jgi:DNA replication protein DnaC
LGSSVAHESPGADDHRKHFEQLAVSQKRRWTETSDIEENTRTLKPWVRRKRGNLARLSRIDVLVIDDWAMAPLAETERRDFWEICEDRYQTRSTILTSQLPVARWHEQIGDPTAADGILDRLVHNAHRIEMRGDSMRKNRGKPNA